MKKILVVDDDPEIGALIKKRFENGNYLVQLANSGELVIPSAREWKPDLILMDIMMPKMTGIDAVRLLKSDVETRDIPVMFLTAITADRSPENDAGIEVDGTYYPTLTKPFRPSRLMEVVELFFGKNRQKRILILDDQTEIAELIANRLESAGYETSCSSDGIHGLKKLQDFNPDLIILDLNMPGMGGIEFYKNICDNHSRPRFPVLVLTGRTNMERLFKDLNVDGFMTKPFSDKPLLDEVTRILQDRGPENKTGRRI